MSQPTRTEPNASSASLFVWAVLAACIAFDALTIAGHGMRHPFADDWDEVPYVSGAAPITLSHLWSQHNEHRIFVPRLILLATLRLSHGDYRAPMLFSLAALGLLAAALLVTARKLRGHTRRADALIPLQLLLPLQGGLLWSFQVQFISSSLLLGALLLVAVRDERHLSPAWACFAGTATVLVVLCGANGLAVVPPIAAWLALRGVTQMRSPEPAVERGGIILVTLTAAALALSLFYFRGYHKPANHNWAAAPLATTALVTVRALASGLGYKVAESAWPYSGIAVATLLVASLGLLAWRWRASPAERMRLLGLLALLGALVCLAASIGWGRGGRGWPAGTESHYSSAMILATCVIYFVWELQGPRPVSRVLGPISCVALAIVFVQAAALRLEWNAEPPPQAVQLEQDLQNDLPAEELVRRNIVWLRGNDDPGAREQVLAGVRMLRAAGMSVFRNTRD